MRGCCVPLVVSGSLRPLHSSPPSSLVRGIFQARIPEWVAIPFSRGSSWPRDQAGVSCGSHMAGRFVTAELPGKPTLWLPQSFSHPAMMGWGVPFGKELRGVKNRAHVHQPPWIWKQEPCLQPDTLPCVFQDSGYVCGWGNACKGL